jgi:NTP pyrophosphatase (non-canonical NTP hydrolase)
MSEVHDLKWYIIKCGESANKKGWTVTWEDLPAYLMATIHEVTSGFDEGWRDDNKEKMAEEIGDCFIRLAHICHDLNIDLEEIVQRLMKENESRPFKHGRKRI